MMRTFGTRLKLSKSFENVFSRDVARPTKNVLYIYIHDDDDASKLREKSL